MATTMISVLDTTYREGKQSYLGHQLPDDISSYIDILKKIGIDRAEIAYPFTTAQYLSNVQKLLSAHPGFRVTVHSALDKNNFKKLSEIGVVEIGVSLKIKDVSNPDIESQVLLIREVIESCKDKISLRVGIEFAFKIPVLQLVLLCKEISSIKEVNRISLSDTDGSVCHEDVIQILSILDRELPVTTALELHFHNDRGQANANFYQSLSYFYDRNREIIIDTSIGGIGERNGILSLGDFFSVLQYERFDFLRSKYDTRYYAEIFNFVFKDSVFNKDPLNPKYFTQSSGLHISKFLESGIYGGLDPKKFGFSTELVFNETTSSDSISAIAEKRLSAHLDKVVSTEIASEIRQLSLKQKRSLSEQEVLEYVRKKTFTN